MTTLLSSASSGDLAKGISRRHHGHVAGGRYRGGEGDDIENPNLFHDGDAVPLHSSAISAVAVAGILFQGSDKV